MGSFSSRLLFNSQYRQQSFNDSTVNSSFRHARGQVENKLRDLGTYLPLYNAAVKGEWKDARNFFDQDKEALTAKITFTSESALHIAVGTGKAIDFVEKLVREMTPENLAATNRQGDTALSVAAMVGNIKAANIMVNKNPDLPNIPGKHGFPIHKAARFGHKKMVEYLWRVTKLDIESNPFVGEFGGRLLTDFITADFYDIALELVNRYPETATMEIAGVGSPLTVLTKKPTTFLRGRVSTRWTSSLFSDTSCCCRKRKERRLMETQARELLKALCKEILELEDAKVESLFKQPLHNAVELGIPEVIEEIVEAFPPAIWFTDKNNYNIFQLAVLNRREEVFKLIYQMTDFKFLITSYTDSQDNNLLHLAGRLPPPDRLSLVPGPAFQVQREMQWFTEVGKCVQPQQRVAKNKEGQTPEMVFTNAHQELMKEGVKWIKGITTSSTVFATLVATVAFAGGMHVPDGSTVAFDEGMLVPGGSTNSTTVTPHKKGFILFIAADTCSFLLSVISILTFFSIIISRHSEADFLYIVPQWLYFGLSILFISINTFLIAFGVALYLLVSPNIPLLVEYVFIVLIGVSFFPILYPVLWSINERARFGKKGQRPLH